MPSGYMHVRLVTLLAFILASSSFAQSELKLEHDSSWEIVGKECTIRASQLANLRAEETGPLFLSLYAKPDTGYDGNGSPGRLVARAPLGVLSANGTLNNIVVTTKARGVPRREQFTALVVEELSGKKTYTIVDYVVYTSTYTFPAKQNGGVGSQDSGVGTGNVAFEGSAAIGGVGRFGDFNVDRIQNHRETLTGLLRLAVYATVEPYAGGGDATIIATRPLGHLAPGDYYNHLQGRLTLKRPGRGAFYISLVLEEDLGNGFQPVIYVNAPDPRPF